MSQIRPNNGMFLHELWVRSRFYREHQARCAKAKLAGKPRPPIPDAIRARFVVRREDLGILFPKSGEGDAVCEPIFYATEDDRKEGRRSTIAPGIANLYKENDNSGVKRRTK